MKKWYAVYADDRERRRTLVLEGKLGEQDLARFDEVSKTDALDGRPVIGMWVEEHNGEQVDVIRIHGAVPSPEIDRRFKAYQARRRLN